MFAVFPRQFWGGACWRVWCLCALLLAALPAAQAQTYRLTQLGSSYAYSSDIQSINSRGQVIFNDPQTPGSPTRAYFHDGSTARDLGTLGGTSTTAVALNDAGQVVGEASTGQIAMPSQTLITRAFLWSASTGMVDLGSLGDTARATALNASGQVIGTSRTSAGQIHAFFWSSATGMVDLTPPGSSSSGVVGLNAQGQVAGWHVLGDGTRRSFLWSRTGGWTDLPLFPVAVNDAGQVVGNIPGANGDHAAVWSATGGLIDLGVGDPADSFARAISPSGQVVGGYRTNDGTLRGFSWTAAGGRVDLGTLGRDVDVPIRQSVNRAGQVVGSAVAPDGSFRAFLWSATGGMVDLNTRVVAAPAGLVLIQAFGIADNGAIIAGSTTGVVLLSANTATTAAPVLGSVEASDPITTGRATAFSAAFTDADTSDTHTAVWSWGDGSAPGNGVVTERTGQGTVSANHVFTTAGVYTVTVTVTDSGGRGSSASREVTVYDPSRGFVVGAGMVLSPRGAFKADPTVRGRATFALMSRYVPGEALPPGRTVFLLRGAAMAFRGQTQGGVTLQGTRASWTGTGRLNGLDGHQFAVTVLDASTPGSLGHGRLHLRIWHTSREGGTVVDYDNVTDAATLGTPREGMVPLAGRILVRRRGGP